MSLLSVARIAVLAATLAPYAALAGQQLTVSDLITGKFPSKIAVADLTDKYHALKIVSSGPIPDPLAAYTPMMMLSGGSMAASVTEVFSAFEDSWSDGTIVKLEGHDFLVTYRPDSNSLAALRPGSASSSTASSAQFPKDLKLALIRVDGIQVISPDPDLTKETLIKLSGGPQEAGSVSQAAASTTTLSNIKQVALGMVMYTADWDDVFPWPQGQKAVQFATAPYLKNANVWHTLNPNGGEIRFNMALGGVSTVALESPAETVMFYETKAWPDGRRGVAYADGHAKLEAKEKWEQLEKQLTKKFPKTVKRPLPLNYGVGTPQ